MRKEQKTNKCLDLIECTVLVTLSACTFDAKNSIDAFEHVPEGTRGLEVEFRDPGPVNGVWGLGFRNPGPEYTKLLMNRPSGR